MSKATEINTRELAPVLLFVYNRPWHTRQTLEALQRNALADQSLLYIICDGIREHATAAQVEAVQAVRSLIRQEKWCKEVIIIERETNLGPLHNIMDGITEIVARHGRVIVLEDDLITSPGFLTYMNEALELYKDDEQVMHIAGYIYPLEGTLPETFFYRQASCWGWATWARAWALCERDHFQLLEKIHRLGEKKIREIDFDGTGHFLQTLEANAAGTLVTWDDKWHFSVYLNNGLCLHPGKSLVRNIGHDNSGHNCPTTNKYEVVPVDKVRVERIPIVDYKPVYKKLFHFHHGTSNSWRRRLKRLVTIIPEHIRHAIMRYTLKIGHYLKQFEETRHVRFVRQQIPFQNNLLSIVDMPTFLAEQEWIFERKALSILSQTDEPLIIDLSADIGISLMYYLKEYPKAKLVAFEPDLRKSEAMQQNISTIGLQNVEVIPSFDSGELYNNNSVLSETLERYRGHSIALYKLIVESNQLTFINRYSFLLDQSENLVITYRAYARHLQGLDELLSILKGKGFRFYIDDVKPFYAQPLQRLRNYATMNMQMCIYATKHK